MRLKDAIRQADGPETSAASAAAPASDSVTLVGGTKPGDVMRDERVSEPGAAKGTWPDDPDADWPTDDEVYEDMLDGLQELLEGRDPRNMTVGEIQDALKARFPELEAKVAATRARLTKGPGEDDVPDPDADIAAGRSTFYENGEEFRASFFLHHPDMLHSPAEAAE